MNNQVIQQILDTYLSQFTITCFLLFPTQHELREKVKKQYFGAARHSTRGTHRIRCGRHDPLHANVYSVALLAGGCVGFLSGTGGLTMVKAPAATIFPGVAGFWLCSCVTITFL